MAKKFKWSKRAFREHLNKMDSKGQTWKNGKLGPRKRPYGDYLYDCDKVMFDVLYKEWIEENYYLS